MWVMILCLTILVIVFGFTSILILKFDNSKYMTCVTDGVITDCKHQNMRLRGNGGSHHYSNMEAPVFEYFVKEVKYTCTSDTWYGGCKYSERIGEKVKVYYNPNKPSQACITKWGVFRIVGTVFSVCVLFMLILDILFIFISFI